MVKSVSNRFLNLHVSELASLQIIKQWILYCSSELYEAVSIPKCWQMTWAILALNVTCMNDYVISSSWHSGMTVMTLNHSQDRTLVGNCEECFV